jgi:glyoxylase-like metal-dependent hydrolase (beta-lactamase superfamily II)
MTVHKSSDLSRRAFIASAGLAATAVWFGPRRVFAQARAETDDGIVQSMRKGAVTSKINVQKLRGNVSVLMGSGGNIAVLLGKDGKLLVDAGITGSRPQITEALAAISAAPVKSLINTHWHFDHTDGNEWLHAAGAAITAHENTRKHLSTSTRVSDWDFTFPPSPSGAIPTSVIKTDHSSQLNGETILCRYYGPCHTDGDVSVEFSNADVHHFGDTWWNGHYPFIDYSTGGNINGMIRAAETNLNRVSAKSILIPGHGPVGDKGQLTRYRDMLVGIRDKVAALKKQGKSVNEAVAAKPTVIYDAKWGSFVINPDHFVRLVYAGV